MGRPKKNVVDDLMAPVTEAEMSAEIEYQDFLAELGDGNVSVTIHRYPKFGNVLEWRENTTLDRSTLEAIKENHGPGKYKLTFRGPTGFMGAKNVCIGADFDRNGANGKNGTPPDFLHEQLVMQQNLMTALVTSMKGPDVGAMLAGMAAIVTALKPTADSSKPLDPLAMFQAMMDMWSKTKPVEKNTLQEIRDVAGVIKEFTPEGSDKVDGMWSAITSIGKDFIDKGSTVLSQFAPRPGMPAAPVRVSPTEVRFAPPRPSSVPGAPGVSPALPPGLPEGTVIPGGGGGPFVGTPQTAPWMQPNGGAAPVAAPGPAAAPAPEVQPAIPADGPAIAASPEDNLNRWLTIQIGVLKQKARAGKDPGAWIDYHFENEEEPGVQAVFYAIRQGATFENLISFDSEIGQDAQLSGWFRVLYEGIRNGRWEDGEFLPGLLSNPVDTRGASGHARNNNPNAIISAPGSDPSGNSGASPTLPDTDIH